MAKKQVVDMTRQFELVAALKTLVLTPATAAWLQANDPKALAQACDALGLTASDISAIVRPNPDADFVAVQDGSVFTFTVATDQARRFAKTGLSLEPWQWLGTGTFAVDHRLAPELCYHLRDNGFTVVVR